MKTFILLTFFFFIGIDQKHLIGEWKIESFETFEKILNSPQFIEMDNESQIRGMSVYQLYMDNIYFKFKGDTLFFNDVKNEMIIEKIGIWYLEKDTLIINDLEKIATYKYLIDELNETKLSLKFIFPDGEVAKTGRIFKKL
ncbi:hypothetical protein MMU07_19520 [Aquiflexum sp. LQ15W]|uniref:hypothetical protein n=1 Tax=Cognataquiflexum nitidum TaxID=2922272 RepID=UPI001F12BAE1|nr:hypothetical protein [Cognataquiflexum nitidum]MCH6201779.1 hypothetical protein [Cognataquiflexum nitidum]